MRKYKYCFTMDTLNPVTRERENNLFLWYGYGTSVKDAKYKIDLMFPCIVVSVRRVNITNHTRSKKENLSFGCVDMGQCSK